ncbi:MAG: zf-TFIIB domain-containing protein [Phycisphaerales bacterium]|jgi:hypothetical protein
MWVCPNCGEQVEEHFEVCWNCETREDGLPRTDIDMLCPKCREANLIQIKVDEKVLSVEYCPDCKGLWFDQKQLKAHYEKATPFCGDPEKALAAARGMFVPLDFKVVMDGDGALILLGPGRSARVSAEDRFGQILKLCIHAGASELSIKAEFGGVGIDAVFFRVVGVFLIIACLIMAFTGATSQPDTKGIVGAAIILGAIGIFLALTGGSIREAKLSQSLDELLDKMVAEGQRA